MTWDLLGGIGDFENVTDVTWVSTYMGSDYDFEANNGYVFPKTSDRRVGYKLPTADDSVAVGWNRESGDTVNPAANMIYQLASGAGLSGSKCQFLGIKGVLSGNAVIRLKTGFRIDAANENRLHPGDMITFRLDHIRMSQYASLPTGSSVSYRMSIGDTGISGDAGYAIKYLTPSSTAFADEVSYVIPSGPASLSVSAIVEGSGDLGASQPGIYVDGAHLFVKRAGSSDYETRQVPVTRERLITSTKIAFHSNIHDEYSVARDYDLVVFQSVEGADFASIYRLKYLNPSIKAFLYETAGAIWDVRDANGKDPWRMGSPFGMGYALDMHREWLYPDGVGGYVTLPGTTASHFVHLTDSTYQQLWANAVVDKAKRYGFDGVFVDDLTTRVAAQEGGKTTCVNTEAWEVQKFIHAVVPILRAAGPGTMLNICNTHFESGSRPWWFDQLQGRIYAYPFWTTAAPYDDTTKYSANTPNTVCDASMQEWAFWQMVTVPASGVLTGNKYDGSYWLSSLEDMDAIKQWNIATGALALSADQKKRIHMMLEGVDQVSDPAGGVEGWASFGLCSYLLGQNDWTSIALDTKSSDSPPKIDYSLTQKLGVPDGIHQPYNSDPYFRYRDYGPSVGGAAGGVVVVNGHTDSSATFKLSFDGTDEQGNPVTDGQEVILKPHTGRMFFKQKGPVFVRVRTPSDSAAAGEIVTITVDYLSSNTESALGVLLRAKVPDEMTYVAGSAEASGGSYDPATSTVSWRIGTVVAGQSGRRTFKAKVK